MTNNSTGLGAEDIGANEQAIIDEIVRMSFKTLKEMKGGTRRGQHPKHHGCVDATFSILPDIPDGQKHGIFAKQKDYPALIRFSNGGKTDDQKADAHGMAIKLLGVDGPKLLAGHETETTHDFVLVDHEVFFVADLAEYRLFNEHFGNIINLIKTGKACSEP